MADSTQSNSSRIAKNTIVMYVGQIAILLVSLYTVRVVLRVLGSEDYGVYNVVAGAVTMFGFLIGAMAISSQRFLSYAIGKNDEELLRKNFRATLTIYVLLGGIIILLGETIGLWFLNTKLVIPEPRIVAANVVYQLSLVNYFLSIIMTPFMSAIMAHEDMSIYAKISILDVFLKLAIVFLLYIIPFDKLIVYGVLLVVVSNIDRILYQRFCKKHYRECEFVLEFDRDKLKEIASFSGWTLFGNIAWIIKNQGTSFLLNIFFGPVMNAAQTIAIQVRSVITNLASNFSSAAQPQIIKKYANGDYDSMLNLTFTACKLSFYLMIFISIPLILNVDYVLSIWLNDVPEYANSFVILMLCEASIEAMSTPTASANQATGKIKYYQTVIGILGILNLPISYLLLRLNFSVIYVYVTSCLLQFLIVVHRLLCLERIKSGSFVRGLSKVFVPCGIVVLICVILCHLVNIEATSFYILIRNICICVSITLPIILIIGLRKEERVFIISFIKNAMNKFKTK